MALHRRKITFRQLDAIRVTGKDFKYNGLPENEFRKFEGVMQQHWKGIADIHYGIRKKKGLKVSNQFANSGIFRKERKNIVIGMKNIYSYNNGETREYGQYLRRNVGGSPGKYVKEFEYTRKSDNKNVVIKDARIKSGWHNGIPNEKRWTAFMADLLSYSKNYLKENIPNIFIGNARKRGK
jgi:hypothetical protein